VIGNWQNKDSTISPAEEPRLVDSQLSDKLMAIAMKTGASPNNNYLILHQVGVSSVHT